jgi:hypothetical protein
MRNLMLFSVIFLFALSACKKNDAGDAQTPQQIQNHKTEALILDFKDKIENHLKDGGIYTGDSAVWYVEALLNYSYGYATALGCTFEADSASTTFNSGGINGYTLAQLNDVYEYLEENALENKPDDRYIFCIDVSMSVSGNFTTFSSVAGYAKQLPIFKSTDDDMGNWYWGDELGMCGPDAGNNIGMDATDILESLVNATAEYDYFTNLEQVTILPDSNIYDPNFPFNDTYLLPYRSFVYRDTEGNSDFCLTPSHISYYSGKNGAIHMLTANKPNNKEFAYCLINSLTLPWSNTDFHLITYVYGNPVEGN